LELLFAYSWFAIIPKGLKDVAAMLVDISKETNELERSPTRNLLLKSKDKSLYLLGEVSILNKHYYPRWRRLRHMQIKNYNAWLWSELIYEIHALKCKQFHQSK
jgi:hypothetical protein